MTRSIHITALSALSTQAEHFAIAEGRIYAFCDEDECWRFIHDMRRSGKASYATRRELYADPILDDVFHACAFAAFIVEARAVAGWPDPEMTRQRAYRLYEDELGQKGK